MQIKIQEFGFLSRPVSERALQGIGDERKPMGNGFISLMPTT